MPISPSRYVPYETKNIMIKIYSYEKKNLIGSIGNTGLKQDLLFNNITELILETEYILNEIDFPQVAFNMRSFSDEKSQLNYEFEVNTNISKKPIAQFRLSVIYRQNSSWQGSLAFLDENKEINFRSVLELIHLFDSALAK